MDPAVKQYQVIKFSNAKRTSKKSKIKKPKCQEIPEKEKEPKVEEEEKEIGSENLPLSSMEGQGPKEPEPTITYDARQQKVLDYWRKKYTKRSKKYSYKYRKQVAKKRLRIEGRFVTKIQAFEILGMDQQELLGNIKI